MSPRALVLFLVFASACMKAPDPAGAMGAASPDMAPAPMVDPDAQRPELALEAPATWEAVIPDQSFYLAKWLIPGASVGVCTVTWLGPGAEQRQTNIERWIGQFVDVPAAGAHGALQIKALDGARYPGTWVQLEGTLTATRQVGGGAARENWMLLGAVLDTSSGPVYIKAIGPTDVLHEDEAAFYAAVQQARILP
ncbi:MAG TPA: hypothetical protein VGC54_14700 [Planctomycetota bacterium]